MDFVDWRFAPVNWALAMIVRILCCSVFRLVASRNSVHAALYLVGALGGTAGLFLMLSAEFVAWVLVLVYIGAVIVLFLFGIMITRAPTGLDESLNSDHTALPALLASGFFLMMSWASIDAFGTQVIDSTGEPVPTEIIGESLFGRFVIPFEVVSFVLLAALIGGITLARRDLSPAEEEERSAV